MQLKLSAHCRQRLNSCLLLLFCNLPEGRGLLRHYSLGRVAPTRGRVSLILPAFSETSFATGGLNSRPTEEGLAVGGAGKEGSQEPPLTLARPHVPASSAGRSARRSRLAGPPGRKQCTLGLVVFRSQVHGSEWGRREKSLPSPACCPRLTSPGQCSLLSPEPAPLRFGPHWR